MSFSIRKATKKVANYKNRNSIPATHEHIFKVLKTVCIYTICMNIYGYAVRNSIIELNQLSRSNLSCYITKIKCKLFTIIINEMNYLSNVDYGSIELNMWESY